MANPFDRCSVASMDLSSEGIRGQVSIVSACANRRPCGDIPLVLLRPVAYIQKRGSCLLALNFQVTLGSKRWAASPNLLSVIRNLTPQYLPDKFWEWRTYCRLLPQVNSIVAHPCWRQTPSCKTATVSFGSWVKAGWAPCTKQSICDWMRSSP